MAVLDITSHKAAELAERRRGEELSHQLEETEEQLRAGLAAVGKRERQLSEIFRSALDAIILLSPDGRIVRFNPAAERMFGWPAARIAGQLAGVLVPPRYRLTLRQDLRRASRDGCVHVGSLPPRQAMRADGTEFPVEASFARTGEGEAAGTVVFLRDVSERVEALRGMVENWRALTEFFDSAPLGLLWLRLDGVVERVNAAALEILQRPQSAVLGHPLGAFSVEGAGLEALLAALRDGETLRNQRLQLRRPDGSLRHVLIDANGWWRERRLIHGQLFVRDITLRVELEREILNIVEREQQRIGHELHDDLCQQLTAIEFRSEALAGRLAGTAPRAARELRQISRLICSASRQTREIARGLSLHAVFHKGGLAAALQDFAQRTRKAYRCHCRFTDRAGLLLTDPVLCANLFRIAQEAVANALRHGRATRLELSLDASDSDLVLEVRNNGRPLPAAPRVGLGLRTMQHRAGVIGGRLELLRRPRGLSLRCTVTDAIRTLRRRRKTSA
ncbi:MAG: PAS domain-containing sensor histidine kinase [Opitutaceae bacterium]